MRDRANDVLSTSAEKAQTLQLRCSRSAPRVGCNAVTGILAAVGLVQSAFGQEPAKNDSSAPTSEEPVLEEILVTAAKRSEDLQTVPISISAISGDSLAKARITSPDGLVTRIPNLQLTSIVGENTPIFSLRGVSMFDYSLNQSSPVATYYDEVYRGNFALLGVAMYDIERVEVLRGPQGTLYGKNTTGGAVNIISRDAELDDSGGYLTVGYGNYNRADVNGAVNLPLSEKSALRIAGTYSHADGWFKNVVPGMPDLAGVNEYGLRATLNIEPSDGVKLKLVASTSYQNPRNYGVYAQSEDLNRPGLTTWQIASNVPERRRARTDSVAFHADVDLTDTLTFTSISSWDQGSLRFIEDTDGQAIELFEIPYEDEAEQFAQDVRLTSNSGGPFDFIVGLYFSREKVFNSSVLKFSNDTDVNDDGTIDAQDCIDGFVLACQFANQFDQVKNSYAIYSDVKYAFGSRVMLHGGVRYTYDDGRQFNFRSDALGVDNVMVMSLIPPSKLRYSTDNISGKLGVDYTFDSGNMLYASLSRGYRAPSFNAQAFFDPAELSVADAEKVDAYELGAKTQFWNRRITLNLAAFHYDYRNQQLISSDPATATQTLQNIPESRIYGGEGELTVRSSDRMTLRAGLGLLSSKIKAGAVSGVDVAGNHLTNAPALTFNAGVDFTLAKGGFGTLSIHPEVAYQSSQFFEVFNVPRLRSDEYTLFGGHVDWESPSGVFNLSIWGKNLANELYFTSRGDLLAGFGFDYNHIGNPRTYGVTVGAKF